jgi:VIT1/CCC1 family predicted Fe2+/Mn2+ transporter
MPTDYDADIMREQADLLYAESERAVVISMIGAGALGVLIGSVSFYFLTERNEVLAIVLVLGVPILAAAIGAVLGDRRAFRLRAQAQQQLALVAIEQNTRRPPPSPQQHSAP